MVHFGNVKALYGTLTAEADGTILDGLIEGTDQDYKILFGGFRVAGRRGGPGPITHKCQLLVNNEIITTEQPIKNAPGQLGDFYMFNMYPELWEVIPQSIIEQGSDVQAKMIVSGGSDSGTAIMEFMLLLLPLY